MPLLKRRKAHARDVARPVIEWMQHKAKLPMIALYVEVTYLCRRARFLRLLHDNHILPDSIRQHIELLADGVQPQASRARLL